VRLVRSCAQPNTLESILFVDGQTLPRDALFLALPARQHSDLPARLGCDFTTEGAVRTGAHEATTVPGLHVAGDASRRAQFAIVAAAEGALAAVAINTAPREEELARAEMVKEEPPGV
jgi:thioredoxin reductase